MVITGNISVALYIVQSTCRSIILFDISSTLWFSYYYHNSFLGREMEFRDFSRHTAHKSGIRPSSSDLLSLYYSILISFALVPYSPQEKQYCEGEIMLLSLFTDKVTKIVGDGSGN